MRDSKTAFVVAVSLIALGLCGCPPRPMPTPLAPIPLKQAVGIVNENLARITGTLRASGPVDGQVTVADGRSGRFHLDGVLFFLTPNYVRFDLKHFGDRKFLFGSNADRYWYYDKETDAYRCGHHGDEETLFPELPVRLDQIGDALGLTPMPSTDSGDSLVSLVQRVVGDYQQVLFLIHDETGRLVLEKEYWLDRYWPRLVRKVIFRDEDGVVTMHSTLSDYEPVSPGGPQLPREMVAQWPASKAQLRFAISKWAVIEQVGPDSIQFATPQECD